MELPVIPFEGLTPEEVEAASIQELEHGRLPVRAQQRLAMINADHAFTSDLTVDEHHAIRSVGFSPVGQVMGSCVYHTGLQYAYNCGFSGWSNGTAPVREADTLRDAMLDARHLAINRMEQECRGLGGDGVVAVTLTIAPFPAGGVEFQAIGTAVRADGDVRARKPFMSDLTGQDFAKLVTAGWLPCGLVFGLAVGIRHDDWRTQYQQSSWYNTEIAGQTQLVQTSRQMARRRMRQEAANAGAAGVVIRTSELRVWHQRCANGNEQHDHLAEAVYIGTAITPFRRHSTPAAPLPMVRLR
ncbi:heavy metal-binding domain-containing protein [Kibdelosporangium lantanae]